MACPRFLRVLRDSWEFQLTGVTAGTGFGIFGYAIGISSFGWALFGGAAAAVAVALVPWADKCASVRISKRIAAESASKENQEA